MREHNSQKIVEAMDQMSEIGRLLHVRPCIVNPGTGRELRRVRLRPPAVAEGYGRTAELVLQFGRVGRCLGRAPQRIRKDANRAARGADVFDFPAGHPVVDGAAAHADDFAGLHDRERLSFKFHFCVLLQTVSEGWLHNCRVMPQ